MLLYKMRGFNNLSPGSKVCLLLLSTFLEQVVAGPDLTQTFGGLLSGGGLNNQQPSCGHVPIHANSNKQTKQNTNKRNNKHATNHNNKHTTKQYNKRNNQPNIISSLLSNFVPYDASTEDDGDYRILHGLDAKPGEWPWIARLEQCSGDSCSFCTGSLINSRWVLSAGHCGETADLKTLVITLGLYDLNTPDRTSINLKVERVIVHPNYQDLNNDLALYKLREQVKFNKYIQPICLIGESVKNLVTYSRNRQCYVVGYGMLEGSRQTTKLQKLRIKPRIPSECNSDHLNSVELRRGTVCIGPDNAQHVGSSCRGDSGGPNFCYEKESNSWRLFGVVSYGPKVCDRQAGDKWLSVAVDLTSYRSWVLSTIAQG